MADNTHVHSVKGCSDSELVNAPDGMSECGDSCRPWSEEVKFEAQEEDGRPHVPVNAAGKLSVGEGRRCGGPGGDVVAETAWGAGLDPPVENRPGSRTAFICLHVDEGAVGWTLSASMVGADEGSGVGMIAEGALFRDPRARAGWEGWVVFSAEIDDEPGGPSCD